MNRHILIIPGDGIGEEITTAAVKVLQAVDHKYHCQLEFSCAPAGGTAYDLTGSPLPDSTLEQALSADAVLFGAVGGPQWDYLKPQLRPEQAVLGLRKHLGLYANLRPLKVFSSLLDYSPLKNDCIKHTDILIVRELTGGIYFGDKCESEIYQGDERAWDLENYSVGEVSRIAKVAFKAAGNRRHKVTSVDKANVLATSRLWRRTVTEQALHYPDIQLEHLYVDNCAMQLALNPSQFDVVLTGNLFGDILSDEAAVLTGSIGLLPSASIGAATSLYEPIHGSAPDIAGKNIANPLATILSAALLLRYSFNLETPAKRIEEVVEEVLRQGYRTADLAIKGQRVLSTTEITAIICDLI